MIMESGLDAGGGGPAWDGKGEAVSDSRAPLSFSAPFAVFLAALVLWTSVGLVSGSRFTRGKVLVNRDAGQYLSIASGGYAPFPGMELDGPYIASHDLQYGNAGWFPGYPLALRPLIRMGAPPLAAGLALSNAFFLGILMLIFRMAPVGPEKGQALLCLGLAAVFPGSVHYQAVSAHSQFLFCALAAMGLAMAGRRLLAGAAGFAAGFTHPAGLILTLVLGAWPLFSARKPSPPPSLGPAFGALAGSVAAVAFIGWQTGAWDAFFQVQASLNMRIHNPFEQFSALTTHMASAGIHGGPLFFACVQTLGVAILLAGCFWAAMRIPAPALENGGVWLLWASAFWLGGLTFFGAKDLYRTEALMLPIVFVMARLKRQAQFLLLTALLILKGIMLHSFFQGVLL